MKLKGAAASDCAVSLDYDANIWTSAGKKMGDKGDIESGDVLLLTLSEAALMIKRRERCSHLPS